MNTTETNTKECKAFKIECLILKDNNWESTSPSLAMVNIPNSIVDFGRYWEVDQSETCELYTDLGVYVSLDISSVVDGHRCRISIIQDDKVNSLNIGDWVEFYENSDKKIRIKRIELPTLSAKKIRENCYLNKEALSRIKIYGVPLFSAGMLLDSTCDRNFIYIPNLNDTLKRMWQKQIKDVSGIDVEVKHENIYNADGLSTKLIITTSNEHDLRLSIKALGCTEYDFVSIQSRGGTEEEEKSVTATVILTTYLG